MAYNTAPLSAGSEGRAVTFLQQRLNLTPVGIYDAGTLSAVSTFQKRCNLTPDGVYGASTNALMVGRTESAIDGAASLLGVTSRALRALIAVETNGAGFHPNGLPVILLERHYVARLCTPAQAKQLDPSVCNTTPGGYSGGVAEWDRFDKVAAVSLDIAIQSCSWGLGQILGANWKMCGAANPQAFMYAATLSEDAQIGQFRGFLQAKPAVVAALALLDWANVARLYNGPNYAVNGYDVKLAAAYSSLAGT